jgi:hypothetical protein
MKLLGLEASQNSYCARAASFDDALRIATDMAGNIEVKLADRRGPSGVRSAG